MELIVKYKKKDLYVTLVTNTYVLGTYDKDKKSGIFKVDIVDIALSKTQSAHISKLNSKS